MFFDGKDVIFSNEPMGDDDRLSLTVLEVKNRYRQILQTRVLKLVLIEQYKSLSEIAFIVRSLSDVINIYHPKDWERIYNELKSASIDMVNSGIAANEAYMREFINQTGFFKDFFDLDLLPDKLCIYARKII